MLAHSLRDAGTTKKLAVLVTLDTLSVEVITQLKASFPIFTLAWCMVSIFTLTNTPAKAVYDYVIPVSRIQNEHPANLHLMGRPDLHSAFTKLNLWKQTQFGKIVYIDSDVVAYRAPDELFELPHAFSAAPDIGWPDLFNTGVMVLTPDMGEYYALMAMAERGVSFDGADQGLLNMHFKNSYNRISFSYNVTPSAHYQYIPAYRHFQSTISMAHFIGPDKPWTQGRDANTGTSPYAEMTGRWWAVYDKHYRSQVSLLLQLPICSRAYPTNRILLRSRHLQHRPRRPRRLPRQPPRSQSDRQNWSSILSRENINPLFPMLCPSANLTANSRPLPMATTKRQARSITMNLSITVMSTTTNHIILNTSNLRL